MSKWLVLFEDEPSCGPEVRKQHLPAHLDFLRENAAVFDTAGPLSEAGGVAAGGAWVVDVADEEAVRALVEADPFWPTGLRKSVRILSWRQVLAAGQVQV